MRVQVAAVDAEHVLAVLTRLFVHLAWNSRPKMGPGGADHRGAVVGHSVEIDDQRVMSAWMVTEHALPEQLFGPVPAVLSP